MNQNQKSGDNSTNIQAQSVTLGISYADARSIAQDVFDANFYRLSGLAADTAEFRADELLTDYLNELRSRNPEAISSATDPDMQFVLFTAQREFARCGDKNLSDVLIDILVERAGESERSLRQIVLNEAINVAPKLAAHHFDVLSLVFLLRYTKHRGLTTFDSLFEYFDQVIAPFLGSFRRDDSTFQHLVYAGCGSLQVTSVSLYLILRQNYPSLLCRGLPLSEIEQLERLAIPADILVPCAHNPELKQINALDANMVHSIGQARSLSEKQVGYLVALLMSNPLGENDTVKLLSDRSTAFGELFQLWVNTPLNSFTLTSVGIAIGHANVRRRTQNNFDLGLWIK